MIRRSFRFGLLLGLLGGAAVALTKVLGSRTPQHPAPATEPWPRLSSDPTLAAAPSARAIPDPATPAPAVVSEEVVVPPEPPRALPDPAKADSPVVKAPAKKTPTKTAAAKKKAPAKAWVEPKGGVCPTSHPVKAKLTSKIFHLPGMLNYERTTPDRCYADEAKATADGLRAAKR
ncbi:MAG: hypothetical protein ABIP36_07165 [Acidimicrobiales bacterium]